MIGDGVNDARALKARAGRRRDAQRQRGDPRRRRHRAASTTRSRALLPARSEGRRIISGIAISAQVFLARVATQGLVILTVTMLGLGFPYSPAQVGLTLFTVGVPTLFLTAWARPHRPTGTCCPTWPGSSCPRPCSPRRFGVAVYTSLYTSITHGFSDPHLRGRLVAEFERYTGLTYGVDADFVAGRRDDRRADRACRRSSRWRRSC